MAVNVLRIFHSIQLEWIQKNTSKLYYVCIYIYIYIYIYVQTVILQNFLTLLIRLFVCLFVNVQQSGNQPFFSAIHRHITCLCMIFIR